MSSGNDRVTALMNLQQLQFPAQDQASQHPTWLKEELLGSTPTEELLTCDGWQRRESQLFFSSVVLTMLQEMVSPACTHLCGMSGLQVGEIRGDEVGRGAQCGGSTGSCREGIGCGYNQTALYNTCMKFSRECMPDH